MQLSTFLKLYFVFFFAILGLVLGAIVDRMGLIPRLPGSIREHPYPHHVPKYKENITLRFAMVHDVLHERFPRHGKEYYKERNRLVEAALKKDDPLKPGNEYSALVDDLGVGLCLVGEYEKAVALMRDKLERQHAQGKGGRDLYSSYANLGTFLILWQLAEGLPGGPEARTRLRESVALIHKAIEVYPQSHFGREQWQVVLEEFLLAVLDNPRLLLKYDMIGNRLDVPVDPSDRRPLIGRDWSHEFMVSGVSPENPGPDFDPARLRGYISVVGAEGGWKDEAKTSHTKPVPFDEPALGIIGMWRLGAGANPYFSVALGEIMMRVGQRYIAWYAYERTIQMKQHIWPDPQIQEEFARRCRDRQITIERQLPQENWEEVRQRLNAELAFGKAYQQAYQDYEAKRIAGGTSIDDPHFYDAFDAEHPAIASPIGAEDKYVTEVDGAPARPFPAMFLCSGLLAFATALALRSSGTPGATLAVEPRGKK